MGVDAFLQAIAAGDTERARKLADPDLAAASLHAAAALGDLEAVKRHLADGAQLDATAGDPPATPLLWLCYSPFGNEATARALLDAGADPNTRDGGPYNLPALYAVTGHRNAPQLARLLLEAGADPTDGESAFQAVRRGQAPEIVRLLLEHGADVHARRGDNRTAWMLATRGGNDELAELLEAAGAEPEPLSPADELLAACGRGDVEAARRLATELDDHWMLPEAASRGRLDVVRACLAAGFPVDTPDEYGATALHHAAIRGDAAAVHELLARGAATGIEDTEHHSTPLGWAEFGRDQEIAPDGDYEASIRALATAG